MNHKIEQTKETDEVKKKETSPKAKLTKKKKEQEAKRKFSSV